MSCARQQLAELDKHASPSSGRGSGAGDGSSSTDRNRNHVHTTAPAGTKGAGDSTGDVADADVVLAGLNAHIDGLRKKKTELVQLLSFGTSCSDDVARVGTQLEDITTQVRCSCL